QINLDRMLDQLPTINLRFAHAPAEAGPYNVAPDVGAGFSRRVREAQVPARVAIARDAAFSFYYHANRLAFEHAGAQVVEFSILDDSEMPEVDVLYIGGGYPELYRHRLAANVSMKNSIRRFIESGKPFYAECGGLMYLSRRIEDSEMVGILPTEIEMTTRP